MSNSKPKFTPGPWALETLDDDTIIIPANEKSLNAGFICRMQNHYGSVEQDANAALISAAPEMFEALEKAIELLDKVLPLDTHNNINHAHAELSAALKKARGES